LTKSQIIRRYCSTKKRAEVSNPGHFYRILIWNCPQRPAGAFTAKNILLAENPLVQLFSEALANLRKQNPAPQPEYIQETGQCYTRNQIKRFLMPWAKPRWNACNAKNCEKVLRKPTFISQKHLFFLFSRKHQATRNFNYCIRSSPCFI